MQAQAQTQAAAKPAVVLAPLSPEKARQAAQAIAKALATYEKSKRTLMGHVAEAVALIAVPLTAAQYDRQFKPSLAEAFAVQVKRGVMSESSANQYLSGIKTCALAILNKSAEPFAGEGYFDFYKRAAEALVSAKTPEGAPVWEAATKRGRKAGVTLPKKGGALPGHIAQANSAGGSTAAEGGTNENVLLAAARILAKGNQARAYRLLYAATSYVDQFDKWADAVLSQEDKATIGARMRAADRNNSQPANPQPSQPDKSQQPATAMEAALIEGQRKANAKRQAA